MASSFYKTFALAGAGSIGSAVLRQFSAQMIPITLLTRTDGSKVSPELTTLPHVTVKPVDYSVHSSLVHALKGVDAVVSTIGFAGFGNQKALADAAKEAGVRVFLPSEWGAPTPGYTEADSVMLWRKAELHAYLKQINLPYALFYTGGFADWAPFFAGFKQSGYKSANPIGTGDGIASFTALDDIGRFVVYVLTTLSPEQIEWKEFRIEGDRKSLNQLIALLSQKVGREIPVTYRDLASTKAAALKQGDFVQWAFSTLEEGRFNSRWDQGHQRGDVPNSNGLFPQWNPKSIEDIIQGLDIK